MLKSTLRHSCTHCALVSLQYWQHAHTHTYRLTHVICTHIDERKAQAATQVDDGLSLVRLLINSQISDISFVQLLLIISHKQFRVLGDKALSFLEAFSFSV